MPHRSVASLVREALEAVGVSHAFSVPGEHHADILDELYASAAVRPVLVGHEAAAAFIASGVSRTGESLGTLLIDPAAGIAAAYSGLAQAFHAGIPLLVISLRQGHETNHAWHGIDQHALLQPVIKASWLVQRHADVIPRLYEAARLANSGKPGPVFVDVDLPSALGQAGATPPWMDMTQPSAAARLPTPAGSPTASIQLARDKKEAEARLEPESEEHVTPARFFKALDHLLSDDATVVYENTQLTRLAADAWPATARQNASPSPFSCKGYGIPTAMGTKLVRPETPVVALVSEAGFRMTALELGIAADQNLGLVVIVLTPADSVLTDPTLVTRPGLSALELEGVAQATGAVFLRVQGDSRIELTLAHALDLAQEGSVALVEVVMDVSHATTPAATAIRPAHRRHAAGSPSQTVTDLASWRGAKG